MRMRFNRPAGIALALVSVVYGAALATAEDARARVRGANAPADSISILDAERSGQVELRLSGQGAQSVKMVMANQTDQRLKVVLPPGLVAATSVGQGQNMGFRSVGVKPENPEVGAVIPLAPGQVLDLDVAAICLNFGLPTPTPEVQFKLMDVSDFTPDARAQKALRSVAVLGAGYGVAQAVVWNVFNQMPFTQMVKEARRYLNSDEISVAARFVEALDASGTQELVDPAYFQNGRVLVRVRGEAGFDSDASRLQKEFEGRRLFGLPVQVVEEADAATARPSTLWVDITLVPDAARPGNTRALATLKHHSIQGGWSKVGHASIALNSDVEKVTADDFARSIDAGVAAAFVKVHPAGKKRGMTSVQLVNKLPFSVDSVVLRTSRAADAPEVSLDGLAIGPNRSGNTSFQGATGILDRIELNGL